MADRCSSEFVQPGGTFSYRCENEAGHYQAHGCPWDENEDGVEFFITWRNDHGHGQ